MSLKPADKAFLETLAAQLPPGTIRPAASRYLEEPRGRHFGQAASVACPSGVEEVSTILRLAHAGRVGVVPYGGGTGLVGGQVMPHGPVPLILSLERMNKIRHVDPTGNALIAEAGAILADVQAAAAETGRLFPLSLASEGSARLGGLLGTNAGGTQVLRWGNMRDQCLGLEAVLADGRVMRGLKTLRKDNLGYDLRNLLIGSEGTLAVITAASLRMVARPARNGAALMQITDPAAALDLLALAHERLGEGVSGFELIAGMGLRFLAETMPQIRQPFEMAPDWLVLIDLGLPAAMDPATELEALFAEAHEAGLVSDGVIASNEAQRAHFWALREAIPEANRAIGAIASHDVSLPLSALPRFIAQAGDELRALADMRINCFGHVGDGNLHYNLFPAAGRDRSGYENMREDLIRCVHERVHALGGSVSAEHGVGRQKVGDLERFGDSVALSAMRSIKDALDPRGILNPGAVLRAG